MFTVCIFDGATLGTTDNLQQAIAQAKTHKMRGESVVVRNEKKLVYFCAKWGHARKIG